MKSSNGNVPKDLFRQLVENRPHGDQEELFKVQSICEALLLSFIVGAAHVERGLPTEGLMIRSRAEDGNFRIVFGHTSEETGSAIDIPYTEFLTEKA